jgi:hypothetical protein
MNFKIYKMKILTKSIIALLPLVAISCSVRRCSGQTHYTKCGILLFPPLLQHLVASYILFSYKCCCTVRARFTWKSTTYGGDVEIIYTSEMDVKGNAKHLELASKSEV